MAKKESPEHPRRHGDDEDDKRTTTRKGSAAAAVAAALLGDTQRRRTTSGTIVTRISDPRSSLASCLVEKYTEPTVRIQIHRKTKKFFNDGHDGRCGDVVDDAARGGEPPRFPQAASLQLFSQPTPPRPLSESLAPQWRTWGEIGRQSTPSWRAVR